MWVLEFLLQLKLEPKTSGGVNNK